MDGVMHPSVEQAIGRDRIRKAFKRYENNPADEHDRGIVRAVNADGSYEVLLDGDAQTARCAPYAKAMVGDRVIVVTTKDGENVLLGRLGGEIGGGDGGSSEDNSWYVNPADYVVEWGTDDFWTWRKYASGIAECWNTNEYALAMAAGLTNAELVLPFEFQSADYRVLAKLNATIASNNIDSAEKVSITPRARTANGFAIGIWNAYSYERNLAIDLYVTGFWKDSPASGGTETIAPTIEERFEKLEVDYIVAEGTSGIWTYRKWSSGIAECWGVKTVSVGGFSAWGGMYIGWTGSGSVDLPFEFAEVPTFGLAATSDTTSSLGIVAYGGSRTTTPSLEVFGSNNPGAISVKYQFSVKGRWK